MLLRGLGLLYDKSVNDEANKNRIGKHSLVTTFYSAKTPKTSGFKAQRTAVCYLGFLVRL